MAENILKLRVESAEYDNKIKRAAEGIRHLADVAHKSAGEFTGLSDAEVKYISSLGEMETKSRSAAGATHELESAFKELTVIYNNLNDVEKADEGGKALAASLAMLKQRAQEARAQMQAATDSLNSNQDAGKETSGILDQLASKFTVNIDAMKLFGIGMQAAGVALDVAKDAFFQSESNIDEWGRTVESAKGAYDVFLNTLSSGNWSNFFNNLSTAVQGARELYDALDRLGSVKSNNQAAIAIQQQQIAQLRLMKQQGKNVDDQLKAATERLRQLQNQSVDAGKTAGKKVISETLTNAYNTTEGANGQLGPKTIERVTNELLTQGQDAFDRYDRLYTKLRTKMKDERMGTYTTSSGMAFTQKETFFNINKLSKEEQKQYALAKSIKEAETRLAEGIGTYAQAVSEGTAAAREEFKGNRYAAQATGGGKGSSKTSPSEQAAGKFEQAQKDYQQSLEEAALSLKAQTIDDVGYQKKKLAAEQSLWKAIGDAREVYDSPTFQEAQEKTAERIVELGGSIKQLTDEENIAKETARRLKSAQDKLAEAQSKLEEAQGSGNLKDIYTAQRNVESAKNNLSAIQSGGSMEKTSVPVNLSMGNLEAFRGHLKEEIAKTDFSDPMMNSLNESMRDTAAISAIFQTAISNGIDTAQFDTGGLMQKIINGEDVKSDDIQSYVDQLNEMLKEKFDETEWPEVLLKFNVDTGTIETISKQQQKDAQKMAKEWQAAGNAIQQVGSAMQQIEDPAAKVMGIIAQAVATMALSYSQAALATAPEGWGWIAFAATGLATMLSSIEAIKSATAGSYAEGGIIPGNNYNDGLIANVSSGELILNRSQQDNIASQLGSGSMPNLRLSATITGEQIQLALNNRGKRTGRGEYVQSNNYQS